MCKRQKHTVESFTVCMSARLYVCFLYTVYVCVRQNIHSVYVYIQCLCLCEGVHMYGYVCVRVCVCILTPRQPPLLGLHGQCTHHSPHVCCCRRGNKRVCMLKSVSLRHVFDRLEHTYTLSRPLSSSHPPLSPPPFSMVALARNPLFIIHPFMLSHSISQRSTSPSLSLPFSSPKLSYSICPTLPFPCILLGVVASHPPSLSL